MKIKNWSRKQSLKQSNKSDVIGVRRIRTFPFLPIPLMTKSLTFPLWSSENQIVGVESRSGRINQSQGTFPRFVIGLVLRLLLPTPTIWCSLDHKRNVGDGVVSGIGTLFSLDHKLYASDNDSDSVATENQPLGFTATLTWYQTNLVDKELFNNFALFTRNWPTKLNFDFCQ